MDIYAAADEARKREREEGLTPLEEDHRTVSLALYALDEEAFEAYRRLCAHMSEIEAKANAAQWAKERAL